MQWWYKTIKYNISDENIRFLENKLNKHLLKKNSVGIASLYNDKDSFYIKTGNYVTMHTFLFNHGFEEIYDFDDSKENSLNLLFGND